MPYISFAQARLCPAVLAALGHLRRASPGVPVCSRRLVAAQPSVQGSQQLTHNQCRGDMLLTGYAHSSNEQGYKLAKKVSVSVHAGASAHATGEDALLMVDKHKAQKSWWQKLSQSINLAGAWLFLRVLFGSHRLAVPHVSVPSIAWLDWDALRKAGFQGCVLDKDNTLTHPYKSEVAPQLLPSLQRCQQAFEGRLVLFSNSAGLQQYDPEGFEAALLEQNLGIPVLRHSEKKPAGGSSSLEDHFGCPATKLIMIGDRYLTDIVYGNRHGMLTIRPSPLTQEGEPQTVRWARKLEDFLVRRYRKQGMQAPQHELAATSEIIFTLVNDNKIALW